MRNSIVTENHSRRPEVMQAMANGEGWSIRYSTTLGVDLLYVAGLLGTLDNPKLILRLAVPLAEVTKTLGRVRRFSLCS